MVRKKDISEVFDNIINGKTGKSYSHKPHLASLPYDHNTNDIDKLQERKEAIKGELNKREKEITQIKDNTRNTYSGISRQYYGKIWSLPELLKELTTGYDIETGGHTDQGELVLSDGRPIQIHFGGGSDLPYWERAGYDVSKYAINTFELHRNVDQVYKSIVSDIDKLQFSKENHDILKDWVKKTEYNVKFLETLKEDENLWSKPSSTVIDWVKSVNSRIDDMEWYYSQHKKKVKEYNKLRKEMNDLNNELERTEDHIKRVKDKT